MHANASVEKIHLTYIYGPVNLVVRRQKATVMATSKRKAIVTIVVMCVLPVAYVVAAAAYQSRFAPAPGVKTYVQLKAQGVPLHRAVLVTNPANHVVVFGDATSALWTLPSGPPAYLFNESGQLVDFTSDVGDSTTFQNDYNVYSGIEVDIQTIDGHFSKPAEPPSADVGNDRD